MRVLALMVRGLKVQGFQNDRASRTPERFRVQGLGVEECWV